MSSPDYDTTTGFRALKGDSLISDIDSGFLALATDVAAALVLRAAVAGDLKPTAVSSAPTGWLLCDGSAVNRTTFATLFAAIGTAYGTGDGSTTFNIPDLRGRVAIGVDGSAGRLSANKTLGAVAGEEKHQLTTTELAAHSHDWNDGAFPPGSTANWSSTTAGAGSASTGIPATNGSGTFHSIANVATAGGDTAHNNMQPYQVINWMVKT